MKRWKPQLLGSVLVLLSIGCASVAAQSGEAQEKKNQELALSWYRDVMVAGHVDQAPKYMADDYIEHDPNIAGGRAWFIERYKQASARPTQRTPSEAFAKGDYVVMAWQHDDQDPQTSTPYKYFTYDVVRIKNGKIQEHWNNLKK